MTDKPPVMLPREQAHLLKIERGDTSVTIDSRDARLLQFDMAFGDGDHSVLPVRCVAERILAKLLAESAVRVSGTGESLWFDCHRGSGTDIIPIDPAELALIQRLIAEDSE